MPSSELSAVFYYVYLIHSQTNGNFYIGYTANLKNRLVEHNKGLNLATKSFMPWELIYYEGHRNEADARRREKYLKTSAGGRAIRNMLREQLNNMQDLNRRKSTTRYA